MNKKGRNAIIFSLIDFLGGIIMLSIASSGKDSLEYYWSSSYRSNVDTCSTIGLLFIVAGVVELIYGLFVMSTGEEKPSGCESGIKGPVIPPENADPGKVEGEIVKKEWDYERHQIEWIVMKKKNGANARLWHYNTDGAVYTVGDVGCAIVKDGQITEFISNKQET